MNKVEEMDKVAHGGQEVILKRTAIDPRTTR